MNGSPQLLVYFLTYEREQEVQSQMYSPDTVALTETANKFS